MVTTGLVKVIEKKGSMAASSKYEELIKEQEDAKNRRAGLW
jgi:endonuclease YncB( thermonuclease family)